MADLFSSSLLNLIKRSNYFKVVFNKLNQYSITQRLKLFSALAFIITFGVLTITLFFFVIIDRSNNFKEDIESIVSNLSEMRIAEKSYLRYYQSKYVDTLKDIGNKLEKKLKVGFLNTSGLRYHKQIKVLQEDVRNYKAKFLEIVSLHMKYVDQLSIMTKAMSDLEESIQLIIVDLESKEANLQMEGQILDVDENEILSVARDCNVFILELGNFQKQYRITAFEQYHEKMLKSLEHNKKYLIPGLKELAATLERKDFLHAFNQFVDGLQKYESAVGNTFVLSQKEITYVKQLDTVGDSVKQTVNELLKKASRTVIFAKTMAIVLILLFLGAGILAFLVVALSFMESISSPIIKLTSAMDKLGQGDLSFDINESGKDELSQSINKLNTTKDSLKIMISTIAQSSSVLLQSSDQLTDISMNMAASSEEMTAQSNTVAISGEQVTTNVKSISSSADQMSESISSVTLSIEDISTAFNEIAANCQEESKIASDANDQTQSSRDMLQKLGKAASEIGKFIKVINGITDQTKLLALNATIEAARAGEAGRGFEVVANEITELAKRTQDATHEIGGLIKTMQDSTSDSVASIEEVSTIVEQVSAISQTITSEVEKQAGTISQITENVRSANNAAVTIAQSVRDAASGLTEVASSIQSVNESASSTAESAQGVKESALKLSGNSGELQEIVDQFKLS